MAKQTFMARVKAYRKLHPRTSQVDAMKKLAGTKPKKVGSTKKKAVTPKKKSITKTVRLTTVGTHKKSSPSATQKAIGISKRIDDLTCLLRNASGTEAKNKIKRMINSEHDKLDAITKHLKSA